MPDEPPPAADPPDPGRTELLTPGPGTPPGAGTTDFTLAPTVPETVGRYRVTREVARGGMGLVFHGRDEELGRDAAVKVLLEAHGTNPVYRDRFVDEARITGRLQHPGVIPVYESGSLPDGRPFFAMEFVAGRTLDELLAARPHPADDLPRFLGVFDRVCQAIAYAHSLGVVHRDLKPLNVMVAPFGVVKVMDWGVARVLGGREDGGRGDADAAAAPRASLTQFGSVIGTPAYMAPEQAAGDVARLDRRTDVFGLGGILCAVLTGRPPYPGRGTRQVRDQAARADLAAAFARLDASPAARELVALAKACLAADPADRPGDAGYVAAALTAYFESDLRRAERDLVRFFELTPDLCCIAGLDGYFRRVNDNFTRVLGYPPGELVSRPFVEFVHPDDRAATVAEAERLARGLTVARFRNRYRDAAGGYRWFEWGARAVPEEGIIFAVARDVTDRLEPGPHHDSAPPT